MVNILVTGATGFIGGSVARHFRSRGASVFTCARPARTDAAEGSPLHLDVGQLSVCMQGVLPDLILHAAGSGTVGRVAAEPVREVSGNLASLLAVLEFARTLAPSAHVVLLSSAALYGDAPDQPQAEEDARAPVSLYGLAKAQSEEFAQFYAEHYDLRATAVRLFSVYGPGLRKQLLWDAMVKFAAGRSEFFGTGAERRDWVHIDDVCAFLDALAASRPASPFEVFNCAGGQGASTSDVLTHLARAAMAPLPTFNGTTRAGDPMSLLADCTKARLRLGWKAGVDWQRGIEQYAEWFASEHAATDRST